MKSNTTNKKEKNRHYYHIRIMKKFFNCKGCRKDTLEVIESLRNEDEERDYVDPKRDCICEEVSGDNPTCIIHSNIIV